MFPTAEAAEWGGRDFNSEDGDDVDPPGLVVDSDSDSEDEAEDIIIDSGWNEISNDFSFRFGLTKKMKKHPSDEDMHRVIMFLEDATDPIEIDQANTWVDRFQEFFDTHPTVVSSYVTRQLSGQSSSQSTNTSGKSSSQSTKINPAVAYTVVSSLASNGNSQLNSETSAPIAETSKRKTRANKISKVPDTTEVISTVTSEGFSTVTEITDVIDATGMDTAAEDPECDNSGNRRLNKYDVASWKQNFEAKLKNEKFKDNPTENRYVIICLS